MLDESIVKVIYNEIMDTRKTTNVEELHKLRVGILLKYEDYKEETIEAIRLFHNGNYGCFSSIRVECHNLYCHDIECATQMYKNLMHNSNVELRKAKSIYYK